MSTLHIRLKLNMDSGEQFTDIECESAGTKHNFRVDCGGEGGI